MPHGKGDHAAINKKGASSSNPDRATNGKGGMRSKSTIMRLNMYKGGKAIRDKNGKVIGGSLMRSDKAGGKDIGAVARIAPDRRWFGNTRVIGQSELDNFREEMVLKEADPYSVVLRRKKIPMALLEESEKIAHANLLETESFDSVFGGKQKRKRPKLGGDDYEALMKNATASTADYNKDPSKDSNIETSSDMLLDRKEDLFAKGQSKRIWAEVYKVLDCSDVILQIVDARNVPGTRSSHIERHIKKNAAHKHLIIVINKCDLVPSWVTRKWVKILSKDFPTLAFHASVNNSFGKGALISLLRQFSKLHSDKRQISVGLIGYPNVGKSSVINALVGKKCCTAAPVPGVTKIWQYITLMKRIFLIDCPGVVNDVGDDECETVLKGVVRSERLDNPCDFIAAILQRVKKEHIVSRYGVQEWTDELQFLTKLAIFKGKLQKGGEADMNSVARNVINDWQRGKLPFFVPPPDARGDDDEEDEEEGADWPKLNESAVERDDEEGEEEEQEQEPDTRAEGDGEDDEELAMMEEDEEEEEEVVVTVSVEKKQNSKKSKSLKTEGNKSAGTQLTTTTATAISSDSKSAKNGEETHTEKTVKKGKKGKKASWKAKAQRGSGTSDDWSKL